MTSKLCRVATLVILLGMMSTAKADIIMLEDFEDTNVNYTGIIHFHDGAPNDDYIDIVPLNGGTSPDDGAYNGFGGNNFFGVEDMNATGGPGNGPGLMTQFMVFNINIANFTDLTFSGLFAAGSNDDNSGDFARYDDPDGLRITAQIDGGTVQNLLAFEADNAAAIGFNDVIRVDSDFDGTGDGFAPTSTFTAFNNIAITGTGNTLTLVLEISFDQDNEDFAFDNLTVEGINVIPEPASAALLIGVFGVALLRRRK